MPQRKAQGLCKMKSYLIHNKDVLRHRSQRFYQEAKVMKIIGLMIASGAFCIPKIYVDSSFWHWYSIPKENAIIFFRSYLVIIKSSKTFSFRSLVGIIQENMWYKDMLHSYFISKMVAVEMYWNYQTMSRCVWRTWQFCAPCSGPKGLCKFIESVFRAYCWIITNC